MGVKILRLQARPLKCKLCVLYALIFYSIGLNAARIELIDDAGREVILSEPAQRIIGLSPHIIENLFYAGIGEKVIAGVDYSDYPSAARALPRVGAYNTFNVEAIVALKPDLVIAWGSGNGPRIVEQLSALGFPVYIDEPQTLNDIAKSLRQFGKLAGLSADANARAQEFHLALANLEGRDGVKTPVFYQLWHEPIQTINGSHIISDVISHCGGKNVFAQAIPPAPKVNVEAVLAQDPELIVASGVDEHKPTWLESWRQWPNMRAVRNNNLFHIPPDIIQRHTPRILEGVRLMCEFVEKAKGRAESQ